VVLTVTALAPVPLVITGAGESAPVVQTAGESSAPFFQTAGESAHVEAVGDVGGQPRRTGAKYKSPSILVNGPPSNDEATAAVVEVATSDVASNSNEKKKAFPVGDKATAAKKVPILMMKPQLMWLR
jgi:hypothetical protein